MLSLHQRTSGPDAVGLTLPIGTLDGLVERALGKNDPEVLKFIPVVLLNFPWTRPIDLEQPVVWIIILCTYLVPAAIV